jgi:ribosomal protein S6
MNYANYVHLDVELNTDTLEILEEKFKFDQNVFRHLTVKVEQ